MKQKQLLFAAFIVALWLPAFAVVLSSRFPVVVRGLLHRTTNWGAEKDGLRRSTPLWNGAVAMYNTLAYTMGASGNRSVAVVGKDGWVFLGDLFNSNFSQAIGRRPLSDADVRGWSMALRGQAAYLKHEHRAFLVFVAPAKWSVYRDKLPGWAGSPAIQTPLDRLLAVRPALPMIDLRPALVAGRNRDDTYSKLNSHWTDYGGWVAWMAMSKGIGDVMHDARLWTPAIAGVPVSDRNNEFSGMLSIDVANRWTGFAPTNPPPGYAIVDPSGARRNVPWDTQTSLFDMPRTTQNPAAPSPRKVLLFRDSTGDAISPFLQSSFRDVVQVGHALDKPESRPDFITTVEANQPDLVLLVLTERYLETPPPRPAYWRMASAYYADDAHELASWDAHAGANGSIRVQGDSRLAASPLQVDYSAMQRAKTHSVVMQLRADAVGPGALAIAIRCPHGTGRQESQDYHAGLNVFLFELRADDCDGSVQLERPPDAAGIEVQALSFHQQ